MAGQPSGSSLRYHDYVAITTTLKSRHYEKSGRTDQEKDAVTGFTDYVEKVRATLRERCAECKITTRDHGLGCFEECLPPLYQSHLNEAFGFADAIGLTLTDDLEEYFRITSELNLPTKQVSLSFCPDLSSLELHVDQELPDWILPEDDDCRKNPFFHLKDLFEKSSKQGGEEGNAVLAPPSREEPLLVYTLFKFGTLSSLGPGTVMLRAVLCAVAKKVLEARKKLRDALRNKDNDLNGKVLSDLEVTKESVDRIKVAITNPQGPEEIATFLRCDNYSLGVFVAQFIASMTIQDVIDADRTGTVGRLIKESKIHTGLRGLSRSVPQGRNNGSGAILSDNHVFVHSYTILGITRGSFAERHELRNPGYIQAYPRMDVLAGHVDNVAECVKTVLNDMALKVKDKVVSSKGVLRFLIGRHDYEYDAALWGNEPLQLLRVDSFIESTINLEQTLGDDSPGVTGVASEIVVPVPQELLPTFNSKHHADVTTGIGRLALKLFDDNGPMDLNRFDTACATIGMPPRLTRSISHLMKNFAESIQEPFLLPTVLDLYDPFIALYGIVTTELVTEFEEACLFLNKDSKKKESKAGFFDQERVELLGLFANSLHHAHSYRVHRQVKEDIRDWAIDVRGGLIQLVQGAAAVGMCGAGLTKWGWCFGFGESKYEASDMPDPGDEPECEHSRLGIVDHLSLSRPTVFVDLSGISRGNTRLGVNHFSVAHIVHPLEYLDHLHEAAHLLLRESDELWHHRESLWVPNWFQSELAPDVTGYEEWRWQWQFSGKEETQELREELFADMLVHLFVFGGDYETARRYFMWRFNAAGAPSSCDRTSSNYICERAFRAYLVTEAVRVCWKKTPDLTHWPTFHPWIKALSEGGLDEETTFFAKHAENFASPEVLEGLSQWMSRGELLESAAREAGKKRKKRGKGEGEIVTTWVEERLKKLIPLFDDIWRRALTMYLAYAENLRHRQKVPWNSDRTDFLAAIKDALDRGETSIQQILVNEHLLTGEYKLETVDPLGLVAGVLCAYVQFEVNLPQEAGEGPCVVKQRRKRLRRQIALHRLLWDTSVQLRQRRAQRLIQET